MRSESDSTVQRFTAAQESPSGLWPSSPITSAKLVVPDPRFAGLGCEGSGFQPIWERKSVSKLVKERM